MFYENVFLTRTRVKYIVFWAIVWQSMHLGMAQCSKDILKSVEKYSLESYLGPNEIFEYDMVLKITPIQVTSNIQTKSHIKMYIGRNIYVNQSDQVSMYADSVQLFSIVKLSKTIVWQDMQKKALNGYSPKDMLQYIETTTCSKVTVGAKTYTKVLCTLQKDFADEQLMDQVEYWIDSVEEKLWKAKVYYREESGIKHIEMLYNTMRKIPCPEYLQGGVRDLVLVKNTKTLKAKYKGFQLLDRRQIKK